MADPPSLVEQLQPALPPPFWPTRMLTGSHFSLSTTQVPMPSADTLQVQQSDGQTMVLQGSGMQVLVIGTQVMPAPHWVRRAAIRLALGRERVAELPVGAGDVPARVGLTEARDAALLVAALAGDAQVLAVAVVAVLPARAGLMFRHGSVWQRPATQIWGAVQASSGSLQSRQRPLMQIFGVAQLTPVHRSTQAPVFSSQLLARRAGDALAALRDAELIEALVSGRAGELAAHALQDALAVAAAEARRALRLAVDHAVAVVVLAVAHLERRAAGSPRRRSPSCRGRSGARPCRRPPGASICAWVSPGQRQTWPVCGKVPLSMTPSQLSSMPLQTSACGMPVALHTSLPMLQTKVPDWQVPRPLPQRSPTPGSVPSSIMPSQSSSRPLQTSGCGVTGGRVAERAGLVGAAGQDAAAAADADAVVVARRADHEAFVDVAVAVVVEAVADLGRDRAAAGLAAGVRGQTLVDLAVAVVVHAVAGLDGAVRPAPARAASVVRIARVSGRS